jgi:two-component system KDP operon response regulator KdpE
MNKSGAYILVVDDEVEILRALKRNLVAHGYRVLTAQTGEEAIQITQQQRPDAILLDLLLPGISGLEVCRQIRATSNVPIIVLSVKGTEHDKVEALDLGADDYIQKPFGINEVLARIRAALRHVAHAQAGAEPQLQIGPLRVDFGRRLVQVNGQEVALSPTEYNLLKVFLTHRGKIMTRQMLVHLLWGTTAEARLHSLHVYVAQLRQKLEPDPLHSHFLFTIPGVGYRFIEEAEEDAGVTGIMAPTNESG